MDFKSVIKFLSECDDCDLLQKISDLSIKKKELIGQTFLFNRDMEMARDYETPSDNFKRFINEKIETQVEKENEVCINEIYDGYQYWFKTNKLYIDKCLSRKEVKSIMIKLFPDRQSPTNKNAWKNLLIYENC
jgi:hypothetical protein